jgi:RNA polymerase sigma-70 factor (ECF subfamily)
MALAMADRSFDMSTCLDRVRQRDEEAARSLVEHLYPLVIRIVRSHLPRRSSPEDLAQTVFMRMFAKLEQYEARVPFEHWVSRIAVNTCINELHAERRRPEWRWADFSETEAEVLENVVARAEEPEVSERLAARDLAEKLLSSLPPQDRLILTMLDLEGHSVEDVRQRTGWGQSYIKVRAFRARRKLRHTLHQLLKENVL